MDFQKGMRRWDQEVKTKQNTGTTQGDVMVAAQFESLCWNWGFCRRCRAQARWWHGSPPSSHLLPLVEMATAGPSVHAQGQPHCSNTTTSPYIKRAFHQLPPAHLKVERVREVLVLGQLGAHSGPLCNHGHLPQVAWQQHPHGKVQQAPSSSAASSLIASEWCQQSNPNPVRLIVLLLALLIFAPTKPTSCQGEKNNHQTQSLQLNPSSKWQSHTVVTTTAEMRGCTSQTGHKSPLPGLCMQTPCIVHSTTLGIVLHTHLGWRAEIRSSSTLLIWGSFRWKVCMGGIFCHIFLFSGNYLTKSPPLRQYAWQADIYSAWKGRITAFKERKKHKSHTAFQTILVC